MILYRAMNNQEAEETIKLGRPAFKSRFKWFGTEEFVRARVQDGKFANSKFKPGAYDRLLKFHVPDDQAHHLRHVGRFEWMLDVRKLPVCPVKLIDEVYISPTSV
jgi:hypothetical protein